MDFVYTELIVSLFHLNSYNLGLSGTFRLSKGGGGVHFLFGGNLPYISNIRTMLIVYRGMLPILGTMAFFMPSP